MTRMETMEENRYIRVHVKKSASRKQWSQSLYRGESNMRKYNGKPKKQSASSPGRHWGNQESYKKDEKRKKN